MSALYGPDLLSLRPDDPLAMALDARHHGLFGRDGNSGRARAASLSAVMIAPDLRTWALDEADGILLPNPFAVCGLSSHVVPHTWRFDTEGPAGSWVQNADQLLDAAS
jgi:hypothetical protein